MEVVKKMKKIIWLFIFKVVKDRLGKVFVVIVIKLFYLLFL